MKIAESPGSVALFLGQLPLVTNCLSLGGGRRTDNLLLEMVALKTEPHNPEESFVSLLEVTSQEVMIEKTIEVSMLREGKH